MDVGRRSAVWGVLVTMTSASYDNRTTARRTLSIMRRMVKEAIDDMHSVKRYFILVIVSRRTFDKQYLGNTVETPSFHACEDNILTVSESTNPVSLIDKSCSFRKY